MKCPECASDMYYIYRWQCSKCEFEVFNAPTDA